MSFHMLALRLGAVGAVLVMLLAPFAAQAAPPAPFEWGSFSPDGSTAYGVYGADTATVLPAGGKVQLMYAGPDGEIDLPYCDGRPGGDDEVLQVSAVQNSGAVPLAAHNRGYVPLTTYTFDTDGPRRGGVVYIRAWNAASSGKVSAQRAGAFRLLNSGRDEERSRGGIAWGDSETTTLSFGAVFNASRWQTNQTCDPARFKVASLSFGRVSDVSFADFGVTPARATIASSSWSLLAWPLLPADITLDGVLNTQLHGTGDFQTADRVLVFNGTAQRYDSAWFCAGPECEALGAPQLMNHWLNNDYELSPLTLPPDAGFWIENRSGISETLSIVGDVAAAARSVPVGTSWQLLGSAIPVTRTLDQANFPATGTGDFLTADRVLYWNSAGRKYESAWFCAGSGCEALGAPQLMNHWLNNDYEFSPIVLEPGHGFWFQNRHAAFTWTNPLP